MDSLEIAARRLRDAYRGNTVEPLRDLLFADDVDGAYAVQNINVSHWQSEGRRIVGRKIGLTSSVVQKQLGVDKPDYGVLFDDMLIPNGGLLNAALVRQPKAEAEIALVLGTDIVDPQIDVAGVRAACAYATAAIEIVDSRITDWAIRFVDTVADNGSAAFFVLGDERHAMEGLDLCSCGMVMEVNGVIASTGVGAACLGNPAHAALWLARTMIARGAPLRAGDILMTGALGPMVAISPGDRVRAMIGGIGSASFTYSA